MDIQHHAQQLFLRLCLQPGQRSFMHHFLDQPGAIQRATGEIGGYYFTVIAGHQGELIGARGADRLIPRFIEGMVEGPGVVHRVGRHPG
ncbi:hypothetical protein D3C80_1954550 [compost metagenome]